MCIKSFKKKVCAMKAIKKWETTLKDSLISWTEIWSNIYKAKASLEIKSAVYSQIHLGFYSEYLIVRNGTLDRFFCNLCCKLVIGQNHWILHCEALFDALDYFRPLISGVPHHMHSLASYFIFTTSSI